MTGTSGPAVADAWVGDGRRQRAPLRRARLVDDVLPVYLRTRIIFADDTADTDVGGFLGLLGGDGGPSRFVVRPCRQSVALALQARAYRALSWGYY